MNGIFTIKWSQVGDAVLTGIAGAVLTALYGVVTTTGFNVVTAPWATIGTNMLNIGIIAAVTVLANNLLSTSSGSLLGIGPTN